MSPRHLASVILVAGLVTACGSGSSSAMSVGRVCDEYSAAVKRWLPRPLPAGVPSNFPAGLAGTAEQDCLKQAARLGYARPNRSPRRVVIGAAQAAVLIHDLTVNTPIHVSL